MSDPRHGVRPSLWLLPDEADRLAPVLASLAAAHGGPRFAPHLTLLGSIPGDDLRRGAAALASRLPPLTLPTGAVVGADRWFRCVTLQVPCTAALQAARSAAEAAFGVPPRPWRPHISLLYGALTAPARASLIAALPDLPPTVRFSRLSLVRTVGPAESWTTLAAHPLRAPQ